MEKLEYEIESITPLAAAGADGRTVEVRPTEIKALMRFWWRALHPDLSSEKLYEKETEIFGGVGEKAFKSKFSIRVKIIEIFFTKRISLTPHNDRRGGIEARPYIKFKLTLNFTDKSLKELLDSLVMISFFLGGIGKRSRRGFGSFVILEPENDLFIDAEPILLEQYLKKVNNRLEWEINGTKLSITNQVYKFESRPSIKSIKISELNTKDEYKLLHEIGNLTHKYPKFNISKENNRHASPIYVSIIEKIDNSVTTRKLIATELTYSRIQVDTKAINNFLMEIS